MGGKFKTKLFTADTIRYFEGFLLKETGEVIYQEHDFNEIFNNFLRLYLNIFEASFLVIHHNKQKQCSDYEGHQNIMSVEKKLVSSQ